LIKDFRKLQKRFRTLGDDLKTFLKAQVLAYHNLSIDNGGIVQLTDLGFVTPKLLKARKFACCSLPQKGARSGLRVIYAYFEEEERIELVEIYYKGDQENED